MPKQTILVVDDEAKMRRLLEIMLNQMDYAVLQAGDGLEALSVLANQPVDLIISDLKMPKLDGIGLLKALREQDHHIPVIVVTAYATVETAVDAMKYGASDYIVRPFELETVATAVQQALTVNTSQRDPCYLGEQALESWQGFVGSSPTMQQVYTLIQQVAATKTSVLIQGETGTGKELVARAIHTLSPRATAAFVSINCAAIPANILESELFGYSKGAFTGANKDHIGKFELANGGTLFLDEITEMEFNLQAKLLRVLQERSVERLGSHRTITVDVRVIAATNRHPRLAISEQKLREDLFYRLNVFNIELPPLRERRDDIIPLAQHFLKKYAQEFGYVFAGLEADCADYLTHYDWQGNVRELENMMERAIVLSAGKMITLKQLPKEILGNDATPNAENLELGALNSQVEALEKNIIARALRKTGDNKAKAAQLLEISERSLWYKIKKYF